MIFAADNINVAQNIGFGIIAFFMVFAALCVVTTNNVVHAALWLVAVLIYGLWRSSGAAPQDPIRPSGPA